jgi:hypothetical protein
MARIDDKHVEVLVGVVGTGALDLLEHQGAKIGIDRGTLEEVPVVRFALRPEVLGKSLLVVMSAAPLDILVADIVLAVETAAPGLASVLDAYDLLPLAGPSRDRLMNGAGRAVPPRVVVLRDATAVGVHSLPYPSAAIDLRSGAAISAAVNPLISDVASDLESGRLHPRRMPCLAHQAVHHHDGPDDLSPVGMPRSGSRLRLSVSLHEPFEHRLHPEGGGWSVPFEGRVESRDSLHVVRGVAAAAGPGPDALTGPWRVRLFREREIWMVDEMVRS